MATPQRQIPPEPPRRPELRNMSQGGAAKEVGPGWRFGFWWIWILVIVGIWYVGFGWGNSGGWVWGHRNRGVVSRNDTAVTGDGAVILNSANKRQYIGQAFQIQNAPVQRAASSVALWIGSPTNSTPMLLVTTGVPSNPGTTDLAGGQSIYASGRVTPAPTAAQAKQQWKLSDSDVAKLEQQGAYIQANQVQRVPR